MKLSLMRFSFGSVLILSAVAFSGCTKKNSSDARLGIDPSKLAQASPEISNSFGAKVTNDRSVPSAASGLGIDKSHVLIQKSALGKEFLLSVNMLSQTPTPQFSSLQSRVVSFILRDDKVYMLDVTKNNEAGVGNIPQTLLLAEFNILSQTEQSIELDFNKGMSQIFEAGDMADGAKEADYKLAPAEVRISYLDEVSLNSGALFVRQVAQLSRIELGMPTISQKAEPVEVRYQIKPYLPDPEFRPVVSPGLSKVGYFEANPILLKDGTTRTYAMKWNEKKTIHFAISANTPEKYRPLFRDALLYWNRIMGENALDVTQLEDKTKTAPSFDMNILQWVDSDGAGYAFADAHVDPRSGEVTSAQIFMPSAFFTGSVAKRARLTQTSRSVHKIGLKGFKPATLCNRSIEAVLAQREAGVEVPADMQDQAMRGYVYETVAHELGHVLGLRHNFAGSLDANYDFKDRKDLIMNYYKSKKTPEGIIPSNSVMEYSRFEESAWNGNNLQAGGKALSYDDMAISYLYKQKELPTENRPLFCTDDDTETFMDCSMNDSGRSAISNSAGGTQAAINSLSARILNSYIAQSKAPESINVAAVPVSLVSLNADTLTKTIGLDFAKSVSFLKDGVRLIQVESKLRPILATARPDVSKATKDFIQAEFTRLGGLDEVLKSTPESFDADLAAKFSELLEDPVFNSGTDLKGEKYSFTDEEKQIMKSQVAVFAGQMKDKMILNELKALSGANFDFGDQYGQPAADDDVAWADSDTAYQLSPLLLTRFEKYTLGKTDQKTTSEVELADGTKIQISLPVYQYSQAIRLAGARLFGNGHKAVDWAFAEKNKAGDEFSEEMDALGENASKIKMDSLDRSALQWILNNKKVAGAIDGE